MAQKRITDLAAIETPQPSNQAELSALSSTAKAAGITISAAAADNSLNDAAGGFLAAGLAVGDRVGVSGFATASNNLYVGTIATITANKITFGADGDTLADEAAGASVTVAKWTSRRASVSSLLKAMLPSLLGNASKVLSVNVAENGVEWMTGGAGGSGLPAFNGAGKVLTTNDANDAAEWKTPSSGGGGGLADAPSDGKNYVRKDAAWAALAALSTSKVPEGWTAYVPVVTSEVGVIGATTNRGIYMQLGTTVFYRMVVVVNDNGTGSGSVLVSLPASLPARNETFTGSGRETNKTGIMLQTYILNSTTLKICDYGNGYPASNGAALQVTGFYQTTAAAVPLVSDVSGQVAGSSSGGGAVVDPQPAIAAPNWRVLITNTQGQGLVGFSEVAFVDKDGFTLSAGGVEIASTFYDGTRTAAKAFDGNLLQDDQTGWLAENFAAPFYIGYKMPKAFGVVSALITPLTARGDTSNISTQSNVTVQIQYQLTDSGAWTNIGDAVDLTGKLSVGVPYRIPVQNRPATNAGPRFIQKTSIRDDGNVTLAALPTVGNMLVFLTGGWGGSIGSYAPVGFKRVGTYYNGNDNAVACWARVVQAGDPAVWAVSAGDVQTGVLYEFANAYNVLPFMGGPLIRASGSNGWTMEYFKSPLGDNSIVFGVLSNDTSIGFTAPPTAGVIVDRADSPAVGGHPGYMMQFRSSLFPGKIEGSLYSGSYNNAVYGMFAIG